MKAELTLSIQNKSISLSAAKFVYRSMIERYKNGEDISNIIPIDIVNELDLWLADEWTHVGHCILVCINNAKMVEIYRKGNVKILDALMGKILKQSNMTLEPELIKELLPLTIDLYF